MSLDVKEVAAMLRKKSVKQQHLSTTSGFAKRKNSRNPMSEVRRVSFNSRSEADKREYLEKKKAEENALRLEEGVGNLPAIIPRQNSRARIVEDGGIKTSQPDSVAQDASETGEVMGGAGRKHVSIWDRLKTTNTDSGKSQKFKALVKTVKMNLLWGKDRMEKVDKEVESFVVNRHQERLLFDKSLYKAQQQSYGGLSNRARRILSIHPLTRSDEDLVYLRDVADRLRAFSKYNKKVKNELARVLQYEEFEDGRVVVQQGHIGMSFYFIVCGRVLVKMTETDKKTGAAKTQILGELVEGSSFGELALMHNIKRSATIICKGHCEFLRVDKEDFEDVLLKCYEKEWQERLYAFNWIPPFNSWTKEQKESASKLSKIKDYPGETLVYGNVNAPEPDFVYVLLTGEIRLVRHVMLGVRLEPFGVKHYDLVSRLTERGVGVNKEKTPYGHRKTVRRGDVYLRESHFWSIGNMGRGFYFSIGEDFRDLYVVTKSRCEFLMVPRAQFTKHGYGPLMQQMAEDLEAAIPGEDELFYKYFEEAKWGRYKQEVVCDVVRRRKIPRNTTMNDVPNSIKTESWRIGMNPDYQAI